jgi:hypothetical protein
MSRPHRNDLLLLVLVSGLALAAGRSGLGFYGDDWLVLKTFAFVNDGSLAGLARAMYAWDFVQMRPGQVLYFAALFRLFGLHPLGYHVVNAAMLVGASLLFYLALRRLGLGRGISVAVPLLYSVLPHYSTDRVWFAAFQAPLSMVLYFASLNAGLASLRGSRWTSVAWQMASVLALVASGLCYELTVPLFLLNPVLIGWAARSHDREMPTRAAPRRAVVNGAMTLAALAALVSFKLVTATRLAHGSVIERFVGVAKEAAWINGWYYGLAAPVTFVNALRSSTLGVVLAAGVVALLAAWYLARIPAPPDDHDSTRWEPAACIVAGVVVLVLGHAIIASGADVTLSATGRDNRVAIAGAAGVALCYVGLAAWLTSRLAWTRGWRRGWFAALVAGAAFGAFVVDAQLRSWWVASYRLEREIIAAIRERLPSIPPNTAVVLDGACHTVGVGLSFHSQYDLAGALALAYGDTTVRADVVSPSLTVRRDGLHTEKYDEDSRYPYGSVIVFNFLDRTAHHLADSAAARAYFDRYNPARREGPCPARAT